MSASGMESWVCTECGRTNFYRVHSCIHCGEDRVPGTAGESVSPMSSGPENEGGQPLTRSGDGIPTQDLVRKRYIFLALACLSFFAWVILVTEYRKWGASWGGFPVLLVAVVAAVALSMFLTRRGWFTDRTMSTRWRFMIIPTIVFFFCAVAGIYLTEPTRGRTGAVVDRGNVEYRYDYNQSRVGDLYILAWIFDAGSNAGSADVDEECALGMLIILAIAFILASAFVPHFWVLATLLMSAAMFTFTFREWRMVAPDAEL